MTTISVHEWTYPDGKTFGCGTKVEFDYWKAEGVIDPESVFGECLGQEPASEDERRRKGGGLADMLDAVPV